MLLGLSLLYVGAVLIINGLWLLDKVGDREVIFINLFTGFVTVCVAFYSAFGPGADGASIKGGALTLLFSATYLWVAFNRIHNADGRGLGWFCLFVAITAVPVAVQTLAGASNGSAIWLGLNWAAWAVLWFTFFLLLALQRPIGRQAGYLCVVVGIATAWLPGFLILNGHLA
ncbi:AmiS/UreI family transporter [Labrys neptuniae]